MLKILNQTIAFLLEIAMLIALCYFGLHSGAKRIWSYALAVALPLVAIIVWSIWAAPKSARRLSQLYLLLFKLILFLSTAYLLYNTGRHTWALAFGGVAILNELLTLIVVRKFISK